MNQNQQQENKDRNEWTEQQENEEKVEWTDQQKDAICTQDRSLIVSAAAGSGKTAVLVERLLRILSDTEHKVRADSIVVVTFTNDAAAQMKQRLTEKLTEQLDRLAIADDNEAYDWLMEQRAALSTARICTIHSFCYDLIREYAENCNVSPFFTIVEKAENAMYQKRAMQKTLERWSRKTEEMELLFSCLCTNENSELETVIKSIAEYMESLPFRRQWMQQALRLSTDSTVLLRKIRTECCARLEELILFIEAAKPAAISAVPSLDATKNRYLQKLYADIASIRNQITSLQQLTDEELLADPFGTKVKLTDFPRDRKKDDAVQETRAAFKQCCDLYKDYYNEAISVLGSLRYFDEDFALQQKLIPLLLDMTEEYLDELFEEKRRQNVLGFSDAEELALGLLGTVDEKGNICRTELARALSEQISLIMVDEYQDSNNKQDCLFKLLSRDAVLSEDGLHYGSNVFLVGDVKQSIYSFRKANPENFRRAIAESVPLAACKDGEMGRIYLNQNFRSANGVLDFVNALFGALMTEQCGEVRYDGNEQLNFGSKLYANINFRTKILIPQPEDAMPDDYDPQAECIADTVDSMLQSGVLVPEKKTSRPCRPGDFCILLRSTKNLLKPMVEAFRRRGIPVVSDRDSGVLGLPEIQLIRNLLRIIDNPMGDAAMAAVLFSTVCGFSAEDLALLKVHGKYNRLYLQLRTVAEEESLPETLKPLQIKCKAFLEKLGTLRRIAEQTALEDCIRQIYEETDLLSLQGLYEDAALRREHLDGFMQAAKQYRENTELIQQSCLSGWLRYLDRLSEAGSDLSLSDSESESSSVFIKTIHKSKGLEYPFVFLAHPEHKFNMKSDREEAMHAEESGLLGLHLFDREKYMKFNSVAYQVLLNGIQRRQKSEEMRLMYVALTRAKQQLFVMMNRVRKGDVKETTSLCNLGDMLQAAPGLAAFLAPKATSMQDWLLHFLMASRDAAHLQKAMEDGESSHSELVEYCVWKKPVAPVRSEPEPAETHALPDAELLEKMEKQLNFTYRSPDMALASKYSVTQLSHPESSVLEMARTPSFTLEGSSGRKKKLQGAAKGTAVHKILQYMDLKAAAQDPAGELHRLSEQGFLNAAEADAITPEQLATFFASELYGRIAASQEVFREKQLFVRIGELALPEVSALAAQYAGTDGILIGTMDLLFREADGWVLVDYKTDHVSKGETLLQAYSLQLGLYQKAAELLLGEPVKEAYLYSFTLGKALKVDLDSIQF